MTEKPDRTPDGGQPPEATKPKVGRQQIMAGAITLVILVAVFAVVLPQLGDYGQAWEAIQNMKTWQLLLIVAATIPMVLIYASPFQVALSGLRFWDAFEVRQTSFMISNVIPAGGAFGLAVHFGMLQGYGFGPAPVTAAIGVTNVWNVLIALALPVLGLIAISIVGQGDATAVGITVLATADDHCGYRGVCSHPQKRVERPQNWEGGKRFRLLGSRVVQQDGRCRCRASNR